ncbi:DUF1145 domain-containing protein [Pseudomonas sp. DC3000-4b1]|uniref:DUF1145 domain-containing protein n=1 Tax=unclassified Pseudomonas TaxID=196821 RepID=UPI003CF603BC
MINLPRLGAGVAKALTLVFWWLFLVNLLNAFPKPFSAWMLVAGIGLLGLHILELLAVSALLRHRSHPWLDRMQILLLGIFHVQSMRKALPRP